MFKFHHITQALALISIFLTLACASKKKNVSDDEVLNTRGEPINMSGRKPVDMSGNISSKELSFDTEGSDSQNLPIRTIHFNFDSHSLMPEERETLAENANWIKNNTGFKIQIEGHCDKQGSTEYNLALGERRSQSVKTYLQNLGIESSRLETLSYGEEKLLDEGDTEASHQANRRVNFVLIKK